MPIIASSSGGGTFAPHPSGAFGAVCCDVHDLGMVEVTWQGNTKQQHKVDLYFFCGEFKDGDESIPLLVRARFTCSLAESSRLRPFLQSWRGQPFTPEELAGFDLETLLGKPAFVQVSHNEVNGKTYANIDAIMRMPRGMQAPELPADFVRPSQRPPREENDGRAQHAGPGMQRDVPPAGYDDFRAPPLDESDLPF